MSRAKCENPKDPPSNAYQNLVDKSELLEQEFQEKTERRHLNESVLRMGISKLSDDRVQKQKELIRFNTLKNEVDILQQHLDPFVFEMRTNHEHQVNSSVYRHFMRMQSIQDMGIPIYSLGSYVPEPTDTVMIPRTFQSFYRRIRRRNAADFVDDSLPSKLRTKPPSGSA
ncbi:TPA: hypothetical protein N0F65_005161 [Lagenidium giganteum]|uniref:Uncharacterized protein n=1 Tax=Lagenidium giganteum TaxID=4803 RepID=A0AAV2YXU5_9STRA|nr:TPA: hypothetical protein N0F65_005161 [Lagenidium giganteum]